MKSGKLFLVLIFLGSFSSLFSQQLTFHVKDKINLVDDSELKFGFEYKKKKGAETQQYGSYFNEKIKSNTLKKFQFKVNGEYYIGDLNSIDLRQVEIDLKTGLIPISFVHPKKKHHVVYDTIRVELPTQIQLLGNSFYLSHKNHVVLGVKYNNDELISYGGIKLLKFLEVYRVKLHLTNGKFKILGRSRLGKIDARDLSKKLPLNKRQMFAFKKANIIEVYIDKAYSQEPSFSYNTKITISSSYDSSIIYQKFLINPNLVIDASGKNGIISRQYGVHGENGKDGNDATLKIEKLNDTLFLLKVTNDFLHFENIYLLDSLSKVSFYSDGGNGADGQDGANGSDGSSIPPPEAGEINYGELGEDGYNGGNGGNGGTVHVFYTNNFTPYLDNLNVFVRAGNGGLGGMGGLGGRDLELNSNGDEVLSITRQNSGIIGKKGLQGEEGKVTFYETRN